jgi:hypothetical protein
MKTTSGFFERNEKTVIEFLRKVSESLPNKMWSTEEGRLEFEMEVTRPFLIDLIDLELITYPNKSILSDVAKFTKTLRSKVETFMDTEFDNVFESRKQIQNFRDEWQDALLLFYHKPQAVAEFKHFKAAFYTKAAFSRTSEDDGNTNFNKLKSEAQDMIGKYGNKKYVDFE